MRRRKKLLTLLYGGTIFLSAFLLFQVQPIIGKMLLPWFGGSAAVWSTCLLFFQALLLLGYLYTHWTTRFLEVRTQALLHLLLLVCSIAALPITLYSGWKPTGGEDPTLHYRSHGRWQASSNPILKAGPENGDSSERAVFNFPGAGMARPPPKMSSHRVYVTNALFADSNDTDHQSGI
jgi:hypothetical protein